MTMPIARLRASFRVAPWTCGRRVKARSAYLEVTAGGERYFRKYHQPEGAFAMVKYARLTLQLREVIENMRADG